VDWLWCEEGEGWEGGIYTRDGGQIKQEENTLGSGNVWPLVENLDTVGPKCFYI
jgi:hypothetical protein